MTTLSAVYPHSVTICCSTIKFYLFATVSVFSSVLSIGNMLYSLNVYGFNLVFLGHESVFLLFSLHIIKKYMHCHYPFLFLLTYVLMEDRWIDREKLASVLFSKFKPSPAQIFLNLIPLQTPYV